MKGGMVRKKKRKNQNRRERKQKEGQEEIGAEQRKRCDRKPRRGKGKANRSVYVGISQSKSVHAF